MAEKRDSNCNTTAVKLLITSTDCDPKAELPLSDDTSVKWNAIVDALNYAKYCLAMRRLPPPSKNPKIRNSQTEVAFLSLQATKKVAFLHMISDDFEEANYQISYDESLMNDLPSYCNLKGLPRFHLFTSLPEDLQLNVVRMLDGIGFARMRCVCRQFRHLRWDGSFNILRYSHIPDVKVKEPKKHEYFLNNAFLLRLGSAILIGAAVYGFVNKVPTGVYDDEEYE